MPAPKSHPLKRISTGSLSSLARSQDPSTASPSGLDFLQPALTDLADEAATLASNIHNMTTLHDALGVFNESFAGYLYALKMNAFCVEWPEAPDERSFARASSLIPPLPPTFDILSHSAYPQTAQSAQSQSQSQLQAEQQAQAANDTYATIYSNQGPEEAEPTKAPGLRVKGKAPAGVGVSGIRKPSAGIGKSGKGGGTIAERKKRDVSLRLQIQHRLQEQLWRKFSHNCSFTPKGGKLTRLASSKVQDMVSVPDLPQARVNKCLIALVNKKVVGKQSLGGVTMYKLK